MQIIVNGQPQTRETSVTLGGLLAEMNLQPRRVAVELNRQIVRRAQYEHTLLRDGDCLEIVTLVGGG
ncbi:MAG: sulfur carrier protein ThiS [Phycisphaerae bacterium]|nr:sulfur carrier protein ThiS [Phycisphaerae bacterium]